MSHEQFAVQSSVFLELYNHLFFFNLFGFHVFVMNSASNCSASVQISSRHMWKHLLHFLSMSETPLLCQV